MLKKPATGGPAVVPLMRDDQVAELLTEEQQTKLVERYTDVATTFIKQHQDKPFFLYLPHSAVHTPIWPGEAFRGKSQNGRFGDWVEEVDWSVGKIFDTLREQELDDRTLVIFTSDNGPWLIKGADGGSALPCVEAKAVRGKAVCVCRRSRAGRSRFQPARFVMRWQARSTCYPRSCH